MQFALGDSGRFVNSKWHLFREKARTSTYSLQEWGDIETTKYDLDTVDFSGKDVDRNYVMRRPVSDDEINVNGFDVRELPDR